MTGKFSLWPEMASNFAFETDALYIFIALICFVFGAGVFVAVVAFAVKYKRRSDDEIPEQIEGNKRELLPIRT